MTLLTENSDISYAGLIGQDTFAYTFRVDLKTDMNVTLDGVAVVQGDFTMTGLGLPSGGNVILNTALIANATVILFRNVPATQEVDYQPFDAFPAETHEGALDKLTMLVQQAFSIVSRALTFPLGDNTNTELPDVATRANKFLAFDAVGDIAVLTGTGGGDPNAVQKPGTAVAGNIMEFDSLKNAVDAGETVSELTRYAWPTTGSVIDLDEVPASVNKIQIQSDVTGLPPRINQIGVDDVGIDIEGVLLKNGLANFDPGRGITLNGNTDLLGHYDEDVWTPTLWDASLSNKGQTYFAQVADYTRIGNKVFIQGFLGVSSLGTLITTDSARIGNLPFTPAGVTNLWGGVTINQGLGLNVSAGASITGVIAGTNNYIVLKLWDVPTGISDLTIAEFSASAQIYFTGSYTTNDA